MYATYTIAALNQVFLQLYAMSCSSSTQRHSSIYVVYTTKKILNSDYISMLWFWNVFQPVKYRGIDSARQKFICVCNCYTKNLIYNIPSYVTLYDWLKHQVPGAYIYKHKKGW